MAVGQHHIEASSKLKASDPCMPLLLVEAGQAFVNLEAGLAGTHRLHDE